MRITICGSTKFLEEMRNVKSLLEKQGHIALIPLSAEINQTKTFWNELRNKDIKRFASLKGERMKGHFEKIKSSEAILVLNYDKDGKTNYIGPNTLMEMGVAFDYGKKIFVLNPLPNNDFYEELVSMSPTVLDGNLSKID
ncbi:hypothetical protein EPN87_01705 [archaeon]|nr:MAG: hypothetical protein EPN87_01705 [archaeon]